MLRIIIADDEFDIVELCRALITYPGAEIVGEACNGIDLLKKIRELNPDVVITDICMPGMTGLELIERAKQEFPAVNFIVMSGYTEFQYAQTALRFGVWDYLLKPLTRHRDYIVAAALLIDGDYPILCTYLQTMRKEAEQCVR